MGGTKRRAGQGAARLYLGLLLFSGGLCFTGCSAGASVGSSAFQGSAWGAGSGRTRVANGNIQVNWERRDRLVRVRGQIDFKHKDLILRLLRNQNLVAEKRIEPDADGQFSAELDDSQFAEELCVELACFEL